MSFVNFRISRQLKDKLSPNINAAPPPCPPHTSPAPPNLSLASCCAYNFSHRLWLINTRAQCVCLYRRQRLDTMRIYNTIWHPSSSPPSMGSSNARYRVPSETRERETCPTGEDKRRKIGPTGSGWLNDHFGWWGRYGGDLVTVNGFMTPWARSVKTVKFYRRVKSLGETPLLYICRICSWNRRDLHGRQIRAQIMKANTMGDARNAAYQTDLYALDIQVHPLKRQCTINGDCVE